MHPTAAFLVAPPPPRVGFLGDCPPIQTSVDACRAATTGSMDAWIRVGWNILTRALILGLGISVFEKDANKLVREALGASFAIETFVWGWNTASGCEPLPSGTAACDWIEGKQGGTTALVTSMLFRTAMLAAGIAFANPQQKLGMTVKKSIGAVTALELSILAGTLANRKEDGSNKVGCTKGCGR